MTQSKTTNEFYGISNIKDYLREKKYAHKNTEHTLGKGKRGKRKKKKHTDK